MYLLNMRVNNLDLPVDLQLKLFDHTVLPILTYGCEVWGYEDCKILEVVHNQFLRSVTRTRKSTPLYMLYGELGRYPLEITIKCKMINFWNKLISGKENKLSSLMYRKITNTPNFTSKWANKIKQILDECGRSDIWVNQVINPNLPNLVLQNLKDQFYQKWTGDLNESSKGRNYSLFKDNLNLEQYFLKLPANLYLNLVKFRTANHRFPCETLRWQGIELSERKCNLCEKDDIGDELHYLLICTHFREERAKFLRKYYFTNPNILKYSQLLNTQNLTQLKNLCLFIKVLLNRIIN